LKSIVYLRRVALVSIVAVTAACTSAPPNGGPPLGLEKRIVAPAFSLMADTYAFPNMIRARHAPNTPGLYANYCFVLVRGVRQFAQYARFDPEMPKLDRPRYVEVVKQIAAVMPWEPAWPHDERIVIPGYPNLREFSRAQEAAVKEGLGGRFLTLVHPTNWRVVFPVHGWQQEAVAQQVVDELREGRLVQLLVTNFPKPELNHTLLAYESRPSGNGIEFLVWDPNNPAGPGIVTFDLSTQKFWATDIYDTEPGPIRAFRMYHSPLQ
jgi:hypothetical protein